MEQNFLETQPNVVQKIIDGKNKRIKLLDQSYKTKFRDIEQRSMDICNSNSMHLEQFELKAIENQKNAEEITRQATNDLLAFLLPSSSNLLPPSLSFTNLPTNIKDNKDTKDNIVKT